MHGTSRLWDNPVAESWIVLRLLVASVLPFVAWGCGGSNTTPERPVAAMEEIVVAGNEEEDAGSESIVESPPNRLSPRTSTVVDEGIPETLAAPNNSRDPSRSQETSSTGYRQPKIRSAPTDSVLAQYGLRRIESKRLLLITDSDAPEMDQLPILADQLFEALQAWFGELPPAADGSDFQVLGHVMIDRARFRAADLMPDESFTIRHGCHQRYAFWAGYPDTAYYRRHLALHEFVHCFMMCESRDLDVPPPWYIEGMAELFGTHQLLNSDSGPMATFAVMPAGPYGFEGWGRVRAFRQGFEKADHQQLAQLQIPAFNKVVPDRVAVFKSPFQYSSSWAACWFLKNHPDANDVLPALATQRTYSGFLTEWERQRNEFGNRLAVDWLLFSEQLDFGFDGKRCFPIHASASAGNPQSVIRQFPLTAKEGWQDTGVDLRSGETVKLTCQGRCVVNETTEPWESSADGISIEFYRGHRLGQVVAVLVSKNGQRITDRIPIGSEANVTAEFDGRVWLQVNDACNARANNSGAYQVDLERSP